MQIQSSLYVASRYTKKGAESNVTLQWVNKSPLKSDPHLLVLSSCKTL